MSTKKQKRAAGESLGFLLIVGAILVVLNVVATYFDVGHIDLTRSRLFSLADGSERVVESLEDRMEITAYFTRDLPPPYNATERHVRDLLSEYRARSNGHLVVRFVHPENEEEQRAAEADGVQRIAHQKIEEDSVSVVEGYRGLVIKYLGDKKTIPLIRDTAGLEYSITMAMKELLGDRRSVGIVAGHGGPTLAEGLTSLRGALATYTLTEVNAASEIDRELAALLIIGPETAFSDAELRSIDQYVMRGGSLGVFGGGIKLELAGMGPSATTVQAGLGPLLTKWGADVRADLAADWRCSRAPMRGPFGIQVPVPYPPVPIVPFSDEAQDHPVLFRLPSAMLPFTSTVALSDLPEGVERIVLAESSENSWRITDATIALQPRDPREWNPAGEIGPFPLMVAIEGKLPSAFAAAQSTGAAGERSDAPARAEEDVRVLVAGTSAFVRDEFAPPPSESGQQNLSEAFAMALNAIDWLAAESDLIAIRAKSAEEPALDVPTAVVDATTAAQESYENQDAEGLEEALDRRNSAMEAWKAKKNTYRYANMLGIPILFAAFGVIRWRRRQTMKKNLKL